jgi:4a-hydroxytetrahydrobiopterin dehydratase
MSEQGRRDFLRAEGVDDWVVLHGGAAAVFRVRSLVESARLAEAVARVPEVADAGVLLTVAADRLTVRPTRGLDRLEPRHVELGTSYLVGRAGTRRCG